MTKKKTKGIAFVDDLKAAPWNPREVSEAALSALGYSLSEFGDISGIVYSADSGYLLCGHQRLRVLREKHNGKLKLEEGAIVTPDGERFPIRIISGWGDAKEKAANVAANSELIAGRFTPELTGVLEEIKTELPELTDSLRLLNIFPEPFDANEEWEGMPEFQQKQLDCYKRIVVSFMTEKDYKAFVALIGQNLTEKTKSIWYPKRDQDQLGRDLKYTDEP